MVCVAVAASRAATFQLQPSIPPDILDLIGMVKYYLLYEFARQMFDGVTMP